MLDKLNWKALITGWISAALAIFVLMSSWLYIYTNFFLFDARVNEALTEEVATYSLYFVSFVVKAMAAYIIAKMAWHNAKENVIAFFIISGVLSIGSLFFEDAINLRIIIDMIIAFVIHAAALYLGYFIFKKRYGADVEREHQEAQKWADAEEVENA